MTRYYQHGINGSWIGRVAIKDSNQHEYIWYKYWPDTTNAELKHFTDSINYHLERGYWEKIIYPDLEVDEGL